MSFHVEPVKDEDMPRCMEIYNAAFTFVPIHSISHGADTLENRIAMGQLHMEGQREHMAKFPSVPVCVKCVYTEPATQKEKIVGYAEWYIFDRERTAAESQTDIFISRKSWLPDGPEKDECLAFLKVGSESRLRRMGTQPYGQLRFMCVDNEHRRQGIGTLVVKWGMEKCAELGIPAYLESSLGGIAMYEKLGFERMPEDKGGYEYPAMICWPSKTKNTVEHV